MSFGPKKTTQTTTTQLSPQQKALIQPAVSAGQAYARNPPKLPDYSQIAPFNINQLAAQSSLLGAAGGQSQIAQSGVGATDFLLNDVLYPETNPALRQTIEASTRPITENLLERILPGIRGEAITAGQFGGSRQGIAEGIASREASRAIGDTAAKVATAGYGQGLEALVKGLALTPQTIANLSIPGITQGAVGDVQRTMAQQLLSEQAYKDMYAQIAPWLAAKEVAAVGAGLPGGTTVATGTMPGASPVSSALGIGSLALGLMPGGPIAAPLSAAALQGILGAGGGLY